MNLLFFQARLFTVRVRLKLRASVALSPVFSIVILAKNDTGELYISMPFKTLKNGNKISIAYPLNPEFRAELQQAILDEYMRLLEQDEKNMAKDENSSETEASATTDLDDSAEEE